MREFIIIIILVVILYKLYSPVKEWYRGYHRRKTIKKFEDICDEVQLNMFIEDSIKIYQDKIEERYTIEINRNIEGTDIMHPIPFEQTLDAVNSRFSIDKHLSDQAFNFSKEGNVEEFFYGKHPFLPVEKLYVGFSLSKNYGYLIEKNKDIYTKRTYICTPDYNLRTVFPIKIAEKLHSVIPLQIVLPKHIYKYDEGKDKPMSCYIGLSSDYNLGNIMEVMNNILKIFNTDEKIILDANERMKKYKENECYWLGLTNKYGVYFATLYYSRTFKQN